jgi:bacteriorhodopsin
MKKSINPNKNNSAGSAASHAGKASGGIRFPLLFGRSNYMWMLIGLALIVAGNVMMIGNEDIYSFTKITLAPIVIMSGFLLEIYAIMHRPASRP